MHSTRLVILGRDGVLNQYREGHVTSPDEWLPIPGAIEAVARLNHAGWHAVVATNQAGIGRGMIDMSAVNAIHAHMNKHMQALGARIDAVFFCPHIPEEDCDCRKPKPGMMLDIGRRYNVDLAQVAMVGDTQRDLIAAQTAGCEAHLIRTGRAAHLTAAEVQRIVDQVPGAQVHADLGSFADFVLRRADSADAMPGGQD